MSENFPFDNADDFLNEFEGNGMEPEDMNVTDVEIHSPAMPDKTVVQSNARLLGAGLLAVGAITQDRWVLIAAVVATALIELMRLHTDASLRGYRNARISEENVALINASAHIKGTAIENG